MNEPNAVLYRAENGIARVTLNRPQKANAITFDLAREIAECVERADLDPNVRVIALSGAGAGFCAGYDLERYAQGDFGGPEPGGNAPSGSPLDPAVQLGNHDPDKPWDPMLDYALMRRTAEAFMSLNRCDKPTVCKAHGFCVAGGTDLALCCDLLLADDNCKIGYPPARVWGSPTTALWASRLGAQKAKRLLFTGDCLSGKEAAAWGLALESAPMDKLDERFETILRRIALMPLNQLMMMKILVRQWENAQGLDDARAGRPSRRHGASYAGRL